MSACLHIDLIDFVLFFNTESVSPLLLKIKNNLPFGFRLATGAIQLYNLVSHTPRYTQTHTHINTFVSGFLKNPPNFNFTYLQFFLCEK